MFFYVLYYLTTEKLETYYIPPQHMWVQNEEEVLVKFIPEGTLNMSNLESMSLMSVDVLSIY